MCRLLSAPITENTYYNTLKFRFNAIKSTAKKKLPEELKKWPALGRPPGSLFTAALMRNLNIKNSTDFCAAAQKSVNAFCRGPSLPFASPQIPTSGERLLPLFCVTAAQKALFLFKLFKSPVVC